MKAMHPRLQRQMRILDRWEREFLAAVRKLLAARVNALEPVVKAALEPGGEKVIEKLGRLRALPGDYLPLLERYVGHLLVEGMVQGRSDVEFLRSRLQRRGVRLAARVDGEPVVPEEAIDFIRHRRDLGRFFEQDQVDTVRTILDNGLQEGATVKQVMDALRIALPEAIGKARAENIARTEATTAFNQGRLEAFRETKGFVGAVEFMAITDARTTPICMERDGLVLAIDDPRLPDNTPPLHYMCRSVLSPVSGLELEDLGGKAYLDKQREKLDKLPPPLKGFGNEPGLDGGRPPGQPPVMRTPRGPKGTAGGEAGARPEANPVLTSTVDEVASGALPKNPGYRRWPDLEDLTDGTLDDGIPVTDRWTGTGELSVVAEAAQRFPAKLRRGLLEIRFEGTADILDQVPESRIGTVNAVYVVKKRTIILSRLGEVNYAGVAATSDAAEMKKWRESGRARAIRTVLHEMSHHAWFYTLTEAERSEWMSLQFWKVRNASVDLQNDRQVAEEFAEQFCDFLTGVQDSNEFDMMFPGIRQFFERAATKRRSQ